MLGLDSALTELYKTVVLAWVDEPSSWRWFYPLGMSVCLCASVAVHHSPAAPPLQPGLWRILILLPRPETFTLIVCDEEKAVPCTETPAQPKNSPALLPTKQGKTLSRLGQMAAAVCSASHLSSMTDVWLLVQERFGHEFNCWRPDCSNTAPRVLRNVSTALSAGVQLCWVSGVLDVSYFISPRRGN